MKVIETVTDQWMIPGGGLENGETERACCIREIAEETGCMVETSECMLEIDEIKDIFCENLMRDKNNELKKNIIDFSKGY